MAGFCLFNNGRNISVFKVNFILNMNVRLNANFKTSIIIVISQSITKKM